MRSPVRTTPRLPADPRMLPPEIEKVLAGRLSEFLSRLIDHYLPAGGTQRPTPPPAILDPYRLLGLRPGCTETHLRRRVRELARVFHPDLPTGSTDIGIWVFKGGGGSVLPPTATEPNGLIALAFVGAAILATGLLVLGIGLLRVRPPQMEER